MTFQGEFIEEWGDMPRVNRIVFIGRSVGILVKVVTPSSLDFTCRQAPRLRGPHSNPI